MNHFKFNAFLTEFPALRSLLLDRNERPREARYCESITIKRLGKEFLNYTPTYNSWDGSVVGISKKETVSFVLSNGTLIQDAVHQSGEHGSSYAHSQTTRESGETILEAMDRHTVASKIAIIVLVRTGFTVRAHYSEPNFSVCIYKAGKQESITELIVEAAAAALTEVRAEASF